MPLELALLQKRGVLRVYHAERPFFLWKMRFTMKRILSIKLYGVHSQLRYKPVCLPLEPPDKNGKKLNCRRKGCNTSGWQESHQPREKAIEVYQVLSQLRYKPVTMVPATCVICHKHKRLLWKIWDANRVTAAWATSQQRSDENCIACTPTRYSYSGLKLVTNSEEKWRKETKYGVCPRYLSGVRRLIKRPSGCLFLSVARLWDVTRLRSAWVIEMQRSYSCRYALIPVHTPGWIIIFIFLSSFPLFLYDDLNFTGVLLVSIFCTIPISYK